MALTFAGKLIPGSNRPPLIMPPQAKGVRTTFFGVSGESYIKGGLSGRPIEYYVWIYDANALRTVGDVVKFLAALDKAVETNGTLQETGSVPQTFDDCTFQGFNRQAGLLQGNIIRDVGGLLGGGFWTDGVLSFYQNKIS